MSKSKNFLSILIPGATVFISSFCIMVLELVAARLIAKHLGSSLYTWTAVIGVVLAGITIGNYVGGRIADRFPSRKALAILFAISSAACATTVILNNLVGEWVWLWYFSWPVRTFTHVSLVFLLPSVLLGTISPVVAKMALDQGLAPGRTVGDIYAAGAAGSIAGTFAAGYYLIATMGTIAIIWTIGGTLLAMAILYWARFWPLYIWAIIFGCTLVMGTASAQWANNAGAALALRGRPDKSIIYEDESQYCYIAVRRLSAHPDRREFVQDKLKHSEINMEDIDDLQYFHTVIFSGITRQLSKDEKRFSALHIGGGGYVLPQYIEKNWPGSRNDVVEIDPRVTEAAMQAFGLERDTAINTINMDARNYVDELLEKERAGRPITRYDFIYEDAFNDYSVPHQLVTKEFHDKIFNILTDAGVYMINMIDVYDSGLFVGAYINTLEETFPYVYVLAEREAQKSVRMTFSIIASKLELDLPAIMQRQFKDVEPWCLSTSDIDTLKQKSGRGVLTDDYAPVENMLAPVVRQSAKEILARKYLRQAEKLKEQAKWDQSIAKYKLAMELNPSMSIKAYNEIGLIEAARANLPEAAQALRSAIDYHKKTGAREKIIAIIHYNLGIVLQKMGKRGQAMEQLARAAGEFRAELAENPDSALLWTRLGDTLATMGEFKAAADAFTKALSLDATNLLYYDNLVQALQYQGKLDEAIEVLKRGVEFTSRHGQTEAAAKLKQYLEMLKEQKQKSRQRKQTSD
jgi:tetratricopeptide (TPR) repeat protein